MTAITNTENLRLCKRRFSLIVELILPLASSPNMVRETKNLSLKFKYITSRGLTLLNILFPIVRPILSLNSNQLQQKFYPDNLYIVDIT